MNVKHHLKSIFAYRFAEKFKNKRYAYLDINSYDSNKTLSVGRLISELSRTINFHKDKVNSPIHHYVKKYNDVPIWMTVEFLDFGKLCAHNNRLLDFRCKTDSKYFRLLHKKSNIEDNSSRRYAYSVFVSLQCFLSQTEFKILSNTIRKRSDDRKN